VRSAGAARRDGARSAAADTPAAATATFAAAVASTDASDGEQPTGPGATARTEPTAPTSSSARPDTAATQLPDEPVATTAAQRPEPRPVRQHDQLGNLSMPSMSIDLSDEGLGPLTLQALSGAGVVHLKLTAADRQVGDALARSGDELRRELEAGGTNVGTLDIGHGDIGRGDGSPGRSWTGPAPARPDLGPAGAVAAPIAATSRRASSTSSTSALDLLI
jgi:hypothetical protein